MSAVGIATIVVVGIGVMIIIAQIVSSAMLISFSARLAREEREKQQREGRMKASRDEAARDTFASLVEHELRNTAELLAVASTQVGKARIIQRAITRIEGWQVVAVLQVLGQHGVLAISTKAIRELTALYNNSSNAAREDADKHANDPNLN